MKPKLKELTKRPEEIRNKKNMMTDQNGATKNRLTIPTEDRLDRKKLKLLVMLLPYYNPI